MLATALVATPLVPMAANAVHRSHGADAEPWLSSASAQAARFYAGHVRLLAASAVLVAAALGLFYVLWETASLVPWIGAGLTALGTLGLTGLVSLDFVIWEMADLPADRPEMLALLEKITGSAIPSLFCGFATDSSPGRQCSSLPCSAPEQSRCGPRR